MIVGPADLHAAPRCELPDARHREYRFECIVNRPLARGHPTGQRARYLLSDGAILSRKCPSRTKNNCFYSVAT